MDVRAGPYRRLKVKVSQLCLTLCDSMDCSLPGSSLDGILQAKILEWVAMPTSRGTSQLRDWSQIFRTAGRFFTIWATREAHGWWIGSVQFSRSVVSDSLRPHESQHARPPCPSPTPGVHSDSRPSSQWCHLAISSSVIPFSSCPQSLPASESFPMSQLFTWGGQSTGVSALASFLPKNNQVWSPLEWTGWISLFSVKQVKEIL